MVNRCPVQCDSSVGCLAENRFYTPYEVKDLTMQIVTGSNQHPINAIAEWVHNRTPYRTDEAMFGKIDWWQLPFELITSRAGDCVADYEEIYALEGVKKIRDVVVGDNVLSYDFETKMFCHRSVTNVVDKGILPLKRVHFRNGQWIDVTDKHPFWVRHSQDEGRGYIKQYLSDIDLSRSWKRKTPIAKRIPYYHSKPRFVIDLYIALGHFIAEGWVEGSHVCSSGLELIEHIITILERNNIPFSEYTNKNGTPCIRYLDSEFKSFLRPMLTNSFNIHLSEEVLNLPPDYLEAVLMGMWLGDGTKNFGPTHGHADWVYSTSSEQLARDIQRMGLQLGRSFHIWKQNDHKGVGRKPIYRITHNPESAFLRDRGFEGLSEVSISFIEDIGEGRAMDITVEGTHSFVFKNGIIGHNCEDTSMLVGSMLESIGYKTRLVIGSVPEGYHMWVEAMDSSGQWWLIETTLGMVYKLDNRASLGYEADYFITWRNGCDYLHKAEDALY